MTKEVLKFIQQRSECTSMMMEVIEQFIQEVVISKFFRSEIIPEELSP